ncbi:MAG: sensor histidine kinase [Bradymonadaceae bacterium]
MEALELAIHLLEKVSVLVAAALVLLLLRPAAVWLGETGARASVRRRIFLVVVLGVLAIWGTFLGFTIDGMQFNIRMVGIIVAGYLGGVWVGLPVGAAAGILYAFDVAPELSVYVFTASVLDGCLAGLWSKRFGTSFRSIFLGALTIQLVHHIGVGTIMAVVNLEMATYHAGKIMLHGAKVSANTVGIVVFMGLLSLVRDLESAQRDARTSRDVARSARLEALQYQLKPHFLFNILNTLAYLIRTEPARARELTLDLSEFLRYTLAHQDEETPLREELGQIQRYVELERARFGEGLQFLVSTPQDETISQIMVPPLILQPLVENAIRHGSRDSRVQVEVEVIVDGDDVIIRVLDDGPGPGIDRDRNNHESPRVGLQNVQERLERYYHGRVQLVLRDRDEGEGACAEFRVPLAIGRGRKGGILTELRKPKIENV